MHWKEGHSNRLYSSSGRIPGKDMPILVLQNLQNKQTRGQMLFREQIYLPQGYRQKDP